MSRYSELIERLEASGQELFWFGKSTTSVVDALESSLACRLPESFREFLLECGGGGIIEEEISGVRGVDVQSDDRGLVYGDTLHCREEYGLPSNLVVIYLGSDDVVWCLDVSEFQNDECPVVSFDVFGKRTRPLASTFANFFEEYTKLRCERGSDDQ